ncbi:MAG: hypothetical protein COW24_05555 [Candidatus Kerfeldbacteria bacterium CG15_BIG_FIL_POST_REV_8_21_14_020_45_12]|uniref:Glycerophosphoryl diester phosphodiesterase membrane domain-containing protein n=1 Tax=Candidatus Kerfeldbacteria bacterium CG15_BIG_FIL_POST_REV_8_21_14_020_45_12 TaxID=2014247 RepID=A0A2M7H2C2_9BACT|nr:MAG: hypothetical protein COW24_05555 [Candidatus Kerfeldbacteria bacterium CG15_BIG_FIL_POST_REV_8_21_14_020_45_12]PJA93914.1 MAG: hypothetical protein CO132_01005 [Candidatus Kerfeldbacteria bacterium CG_4_9_14_3_um_filter_45_8]
MPATSSVKKMDPISKSYHDTLEIYVGSFSKFFGVSFIPALISFLLGVAFIGNFFGSALLNSQSHDFSTEGIWIGGLVLITIFVVQILGICALYYMTMHHERITVMHAFEQSVAFFLRFVGYGLVFVIVTATGTLIGSVVIGMIAGLALGMTSWTLNSGLFGWLSLIPAVLSAALTSFFIFTGFSIVEKNNSLKTALKASYDLVRSSYVTVVIRLTLIYTVAGILTFLLTRVPIIGSLLSLLIITPFSVIYLSVLYRDLAKS